MRHEIPELLLIQREPLLAEVTAFRLELLGYRVRHGESLELSLQAIGDDQPDLVILGAETDGAEAIDTLLRLRTDSRTAETPVLVLSADASLSQVQRAHQAGANDYLVAPFDPAVLEQKVEALLALSSDVSV